MNKWKVFNPSETEWVICGNCGHPFRLADMLAMTEGRLWRFCPMCGDEKEV